MNAWRYPLVDVLRVQRAANNAARRATGMYGRHCTYRGAAHQNMEHARSIQRDRVSRETRRRPQPLAKSACLGHTSTAHGPFSHSLFHRVPLRDREGQKRSKASHMPALR